jgi:hypothetical protein
MSYVVGVAASAWHRLFAAPPLRAGAPLPPLWTGATAPPSLLSLSGWMLRVGPFRIERWGQTFVSAHAVRIGLHGLAHGRYRIVAAHDFRVEDLNPDLEQALAAVFLAHATPARWEEAEDRPLECRSIAILGELELSAHAPGAVLRTP